MSYERALLHLPVTFTARENVYRLGLFALNRGAQKGLSFDLLYAECSEEMLLADCPFLKVNTLILFFFSHSLEEFLLCSYDNCFEFRVEHPESVM